MTKKMDTGVPELHPVPVVSTWHHLGIDFIGPIKHKSTQGNQFILMGQMGDQPWQRGTIHGAIVGPGGPSAVLQMVRGDQLQLP